jgi:low temperature requirement protein LtrA
MGPGDPAEPHRTATPLELLFDLCFVVAIAQLAARLHHAGIEAHALAARHIRKWAMAIAIVAAWSGWGVALTGALLVALLPAVKR